MSAEMKDVEQIQVGQKNLAEEPFLWRHVGPQTEDLSEMFQVLGVKSLEELIDRTVPASIRLDGGLKIGAALSEHQMLEKLRQIAAKNQVRRSLIGMGYADCIVPPVIQRLVLENPGWYTQYTPYQAEISQGRLEALVNFQTMVCDLTGMDIANASLLDEGTAAAEAMTFCYRQKGEGIKGETRNKFFVAADTHPQTISVLQTRAEPLEIEIVLGQVSEEMVAKVMQAGDCFGLLLQCPNTDGAIFDYRQIAQLVHNHDALLVVASDLLALTLMTPPGECQADVVVGNTQRFGVPLGFGGPHAAFFATRDELKRQMAGRLVGVSRDASGRSAYRLALQTREQHIKRDKATSNICTAQVLLAVMASMYAVYHGPKGLRKIGERVHGLTVRLAEALKSGGFSLKSSAFFDTLRIQVPGKKQAIIDRGRAQGFNFREFADESLGVSLDELSTEEEVRKIAALFVGKKVEEVNIGAAASVTGSAIPVAQQRKSPYLTHPVFHRYHSETELLRYIKRLESKDLSLTASMIPLGSCTMKLNAAAEMFPVTWPEFCKLHPFVPREQAEGYMELIAQLEKMLAEITGFHAVSLQPNAGSQGEYAGLLVIRAFHLQNGHSNRNVCLIPASAHGTNPATASMVGMEVVVVACDEQGNVDLGDLRQKAEEHKKNLAALMITYPSTHGVFEEAIREICEIIHACGGQVYMDGANLNAQVGVCKPAQFGADVCHLNLHKTFCIPHGGGGPGVGPIAVARHLAPFLPGHIVGNVGGDKGIGAVSSAPWGSAAILCIPWAYIKMMGGEGLTFATAMAICNANYIAKRLNQYFPVLYQGKEGFVAHECILDIRPLKKATGIDEIDIAKRLMDYGFHAPTVSFPVVGTLMVEPSESESKYELDRFCEAMISIYQEIDEVKNGKADRDNNVLKNAPHTAELLTANEWTYPYSREKAAYPVPSLREYKFWPSVRRIDNAYGDRNLFCACVPIEDGVQ